MHTVDMVKNVQAYCCDASSSSATQRHALYMPGEQLGTILYPQRRQEWQMDQTMTKATKSNIANNQPLKAIRISGGSVQISWSVLLHNVVEADGHKINRVKNHLCQ